MEICKSYYPSVADAACLKRFPSIFTNTVIVISQDEAFEKSQKYKEGKFILEREKIFETDNHLTDCYSLLHDSEDM